MQTYTYTLNNGRHLLVREAEAEDAQALIEYVETISAETDFLAFGPGEFVISIEEEENILRRYRDAEDHLYILGIVDGVIAASLNFAAGRRPRIRHSGEFSMSVRKDCWGLGIGSHLLDIFIRWARSTTTIRKINLRVLTDNQRAIALYKRKGFAIEGTISREVIVGGNYLDSYWMGLKL